MSLSMVFSNRMAAIIRFAGKARAGNDARAHLMHDRKHLILVGPRTFFDSVKTQRAGRAATALIQRGNEAGMRLHLLQLLFVKVESFS